MQGSLRFYGDQAIFVRKDVFFELGGFDDAERHIRNNGKTSDAVQLDSFYGKCRVLDLMDAGKEITRHHLIKHRIKKREIILLKTENSNKQYRSFRKNFAHLKFDAAEFLVARGIKTLGVDYLSVKKFNAEDELHDILIDNITLFEGLNLKHVCPGRYIFAGFPLKIKCDGAPARAMLISK